MGLKHVMMPLLGCAASVALASAAFAGPAFRLEIGRSIAGNTPGFKVKDSVLVVRPLACVEPGEHEQAQVSATAEGIVHGTRRSVALKLAPLQTPGVYAVTRQWPAEGSWVVNLTATCAPRQATAAAVVPIKGTNFVRESIVFLERSATASDIDVALNGAATEGTK